MAKINKKTDKSKFFEVFYFTNTSYSSNECATNTHEIRGERFAIMLLTVCDNVANTHEIGCEHSARRRGPIHRARILT